MKKVRFCFAVAATCLLAACTKNEAPVSDVSSIDNVCYIQAQGGESTKAEIDNTSAAFTWSIGDQIAVYTSGGYKKSLSLDAGGSDSATFAFSEDIDADRADFALFPASLVFDGSTVITASASAHSASGLAITLPAEYYLSNIQDSSSPVPMIAANAPGSGLVFKHLGALLRFQLKNLPKQTDVITFDFKGKKVQGVFTLTGVDPGTTSLVTEAASAGNDIITVYNDVFTTFQDAIIVNIPVPTGTYTDVAITSWDSDNNVINAITIPLRTDGDWVAARKGARKRVASLPVFSISAEKKVVFAPGNLQATLSTVAWSNSGGTQFWDASAWSFAPNQYTALGNTAVNALADPAGDDVVDLFSWIGASKAFSDGRKYGILKIVSTSGTSSYVGNTKGEALLFDWGGNEIDAYQASTFYLLGSEDWNYMLKNSERSKTRCIKLQLTTGSGTINGLLIFPDQYTHPLDDAFSSDYLNRTSTAFSGVTISLEDWAKLEKAGCVFLPATGYRGYSEGNVILEESNIWYWTATSVTDSGQAYALDIYDGNLLYNKKTARYYGCAVRLAREVN